MRHVEKALNAMGEDKKQFIEIKNVEDIQGIAPVVCFTIQSDPIGVVGINGIQACDIITYCYNLISSLNDAFPCEENKRTMQALMDAYGWQEQRRINRINRGVEGKNEA